MDIEEEIDNLKSRMDDIERQFESLVKRIEERDKDYKFIMRVLVSVCMGLLALSFGVLLRAIGSL